MSEQQAVLAMDATLDDIEDLPGFVVFPSGAYHVTLTEGLVEKDIGEHKAIEMAMQLVAVLELTEPVTVEEQPKVGDVCTVAFMRDNKFGAAALKEVLKPLADILGTRVIGEICSKAKGAQLMVVIKRTYDDKKDRHYANIKKIAVV